MPDETFGPLWAFTDIEQAVLGHYKHWINIWLGGRERRLGIPPLTIARPKSYIAKQTFTALPGEERTPIVISVCDGFADTPQRRGDGTYDAWMRFGIAVVCMASIEGAARQLAGHYQSVLVGIALKHRSIRDGQIVMNQFVDLRVEDIDEEDIGRSMSAVRVELIYKVQHFAEDFNPPEWIEPPIEPHPDDPVVLRHYETVDIVDRIEE
jgi:hypothetical protein